MLVPEHKPELMPQQMSGHGVSVHVCQATLVTIVCQYMRPVFFQNHLLGWGSLEAK